MTLHVFVCGIHNSYVGYHLPHHFHFTAAAATLSYMMSTPQSTPPGAHAMIVSPEDGQQVHIPATPVSRKLAMDGQMKEEEEEDVVMASSDAPSSQIHSTSSSTTSLPTMAALEVNPSPDASSSNVTTAAELEGAQANALLSRRIEEYKARHHHSK